MTQAWLLLLGALAGALTGLSKVSVLLSGAQHVANLFKTVLEFVSIPLIFLSIVTALSGMNSRRDVAHVGGRTLMYTLLTTLVSAAVGLALFLGINPSGSALGNLTALPAGATAQGSYFAFLFTVIPANIMYALSATGTVTLMVFVALFLGLAILSLPLKQRQSTHRLFSLLFTVFVRLSQVVLYAMPVIVWAFMAVFFSTVGQQGEQLVNLALYVVTVLAANIIQGTIILPLFLWIKDLSPQKLFTAFRPALALAFVSKSSNIALPVTIECAQERAGIRSSIAKFVLPLCSTINMNGCAAFILITVLFVATSNGVPLSFIDMIAWIVVATVAAIGNAGVPMGCFFLTSAFLAHMKLPLAMMGIILPLYTLLDMVETALNVWSDSCVAAVVNKEIAPSAHEKK